MTEHIVRITAIFWIFFVSGESQSQSELLRTYGPERQSQWMNKKKNIEHSQKPGAPHKRRTASAPRRCVAKKSNGVPQIEIKNTVDNLWYPTENVNIYINKRVIRGTLGSTKMSTKMST